MKCFICSEEHDIGFVCNKAANFVQVPYVTNDLINHPNIIQQLADKQAQISELKAKVDEINNILSTFDDKFRNLCLAFDLLSTQVDEMQDKEMI